MSVITVTITDEVLKQFDDATDETVRHARAEVDGKATNELFLYVSTELDANILADVKTKMGNLGYQVDP